MSDSKLSFKMNTELGLLPAENASRRTIELAIQAPQPAARPERLPLNLALVIDRSGSMGHEKLGFAKEAALHVLDLLNDNDRAALVAFDDQVYNLSDSLPVTANNRAELRAKIQSIQARGSTDLGGGWLQGCKNAAVALLSQGINRTLLLTDGLANAGIQDLEELGMHARQIHSRGVSTSTFGVGLDFNENLLETMANQGGGNFYFIDSPSLIPDIFLREFKELSEGTARDVELEVILPSSVSAHVMGGWKHEREGQRLRIFPGSLASGIQRAIYIKFEFPALALLQQLEISAVCRAKGLESALFEEKSALVFRVASTEEVGAALPDKDLLARASVVEVADAAGEALKLERTGRLDQAHEVLSNALNQVGESMPAPQAAQYQALAQRMQHGLNETDRKTSHYNNYTQKQRR